MKGDRELNGISNLIQRLVAEKRPGRNFLKENQISGKSKFVSDVGFPENPTFDPEQECSPEFLRELAREYQSSDVAFAGLVGDLEIPCAGLPEFSLDINSSGAVRGYRC